MTVLPMKPRYFATPAAWRDWLARNHQSCPELWVGFYKKGTGRASITWPESVDQALCFGWIDGVRKSVDEERYVIRFSPRRPDSAWSVVNSKRVTELKKAGLMSPAGLKAAANRTAAKSAIYTYEQRRDATLGREYEALFKKQPLAWTYFSAQPPSYRRLCAFWVTSAKKEETRLRRLTSLIRDSAQGRRIQGLEKKPSAK
jgi:uncharacterized protein YdeI (YjbR/CyaY-like superfamily)